MSMKKIVLILLVAVLCATPLYKYPSVESLTAKAEIATKQNEECNHKDCEHKNPDEKTETEIDLTYPEKQAPHILFESIHKRGINYRSFEMSDGTTKTEIFPYPIFVKNDEGFYVPIKSVSDERIISDEKTTDRNLKDSSDKLLTEKTEAEKELTLKAEQELQSKLLSKHKIDSNEYIKLDLNEIIKTGKIISVKLNYDASKTGYFTSGAPVSLSLVENFSSETITSDGEPEELLNFKNEIISGKSEIEIPTDEIEDNIITLGLISESGTDINADIYNSINNAVMVTTTSVDLTGIQDGYSLETFPLNGITNYVNVYSKSNTAVVNYIGLSSALAPLRVSGIYNLGYSDMVQNICNNTGRSYNYGACGKDFKLNYEQYLIAFYDFWGAVEYYIYIDADGSQHFFVNEPNNKIKCACCDLYVYKSQNSIGSFSREYLYFDNAGRLKRIVSEDYQKIDIAFNSTGNISTVKNYVGAGTALSPASQLLQTLTFSYTSNKLTQITSDYSDTVSFSYSGTNLMSVTLNNNTIASISYSDNYLYKISDYFGDGYLFTRSGKTVNSVENVLNGDYAEFFESGNTVTVGYTVKGNSPAYKKYSFNSSGACESSYSYQNTVNEKILSFNASGEFSSGDKYSSNYQVEENFNKIPNARFEIIENGSIPNWLMIENNNFYSPYYQNYDDTKMMYLPPAGFAVSPNFTGGHSVKTRHCLTMRVVSICTKCALTVEINKNGSVILTKKSDLFARDCYINIPFDLNSYSTLSLLLFRSGNCTHPLYIDDVSFSNAVNYSYMETADGKKQITNYTPDALSLIYVDNQGRQCEAANVDKIMNTTEFVDYNYNTAAGFTHRLTSIQNGADSTQYTYNGTGQISSVKTISANLKSAVSYEYNSLGFPIKTISADGVYTYYKYNAKKQLEKQITCSNDGNYSEWETHSGHSYDVITSYTYDALGRANAVNDGSNYNSAAYSQSNTSYTGAGGTYRFSYNSTGNLSTINNRGKDQIIYSYNSDNKLKSTTFNYTYQYNEFQYDSAGRLSRKDCYRDFYTLTDTFTYQYDTNGDLTGVNSNGVTTNYYDFRNINNSERIITSGNGYSGEIAYNYDDNDVLRSKYYRIGSFSTTQGLNYDTKRRPYSETDSNFKSTYSYDGLNRLSDYKVYTSGGALLQSYTYSYQTTTINSETVNTSLLISITDNLNSANSTSYLYNISGNIAIGNGSIYAYDSANRLSAELELAAMIETKYTYDGNNNLVSVKKGNYGTNQSTYSTIYSAAYDADRITSVTTGGATKYFVYDEMGNPTKYKTDSVYSANNMTWDRGKMLASGSLNGNSFAYKYDAFGTRYKKTVNGAETKYYLEGDKIIGEDRNGTVIYYIYDATGVAGMVYGGSTYYFAKNLQGDILKVLNSSGSVVASYTYDSWGNVLTSSGSLASVNPFRYRSYYYDTETGFYYLQSRYYDPSIRRFINADDMTIAGDLYAGLQLNMYAYCGNNPLLCIKRGIQKGTKNSKNQLKSNQITCI